MRRSVAGQFIGCQLISKTDGGPVTTGTTTVYITGNAGTQGAGSVGSGVCTHEGNGFWTYAPSAAETNFTQVGFTFVNSAAVNATVQTYPMDYNASGQVAIGTNNDKTGYTVAAGGIPVGAFAAGAITDAATAVDAETAIANAVKAIVVESQGSYTLQQALSIILSVVAGITADGGATIKTPNGVATRVTATVNGSNERTAMSVSPSA